VGNSNRAYILRLGGSEEEPLQAILERFKGPVAQKIFVTSHSGKPEQDASLSDWTGYAVQISMTNTSTAPPITTDLGLLWSFHVRSRNRIQGLIRVRTSIPPTNSTRTLKRNRVVSLQDYALQLNVSLIYRSCSVHELYPNRDMMLIKERTWAILCLFWPSAFSRPTSMSVIDRIPS
jgi:hypothetical protein